MQGINDITLGFRHLSALLVTNERVDIDIFKRNLFLKVKAHHHHSGNPKENNVKACN